MEESGKLPMSRRTQIILVLLLVVFVFLSRGLFLGFPGDKVFDEVHYVRAANAYVAGQEDPNWEHPPLGKMMIATGILIFGDNPWGWRFFPYLFGCLTVFLVFWLARTLGLGMGGALFAAFLFSWDFLSFVMGRMAMLDIFVSTLITLSLLFAARYYKSRNKWDFLFTMVACGLAISSKWSALYPAVFLGFFFLALPPFFRHLRGSVLRFLTNGLLVLLCFIVVVGGIYAFTYSYYFSFGHTAQDWVKLHTDAWAWHTRPNIDHPYASQWWSWPLMTKGVWYYYNTTPEGITQGILAIGNPVLWYLGGLAILVLILGLTFWIYDKNRFIPLFILFGFLVNYIPWIISSKGGFIFYMLPAIPFYALGMTYFINRTWRYRFWRGLSWVFVILTFLVFALFYPLLTGLPVYQETFLRALWSGSFFGF